MCHRCVIDTSMFVDGLHHSVQTDFLCVYRRYFNTPHLQIEGERSPLLPLETRTLTLIFSPKEAKRYLEHIPIRLGSCANPLQVTVKGEGTHLRVEAVKGAQDVVNFGVVACGAETTLSIKVLLQRSCPLSPCVPHDYETRKA